MPKCENFDLFFTLIHTFTITSYLGRRLEDWKKILYFKDHSRYSPFCVFCACWVCAKQMVTHAEHALKTLLRICGYLYIPYRAKCFIKDLQWKKNNDALYITLGRQKMKGLIVHYVDRNNVSTSLDNFQNICYFRLRDIVLLQVFKKNCVGHYVVKPSTHPTQYCEHIFGWYFYEMFIFLYTRNNFIVGFNQ